MRDIKLTNNNGSIQLKFTVSGKRYSFNPVPGGKYSDKRDRALASSIATRIQNDILAGVFDPTLTKYKHQSSPESAPQIPVSAKSPQRLLEVWDAWVESLNLAPATKADHYEMIRRMIARANAQIPDARWLLEADIAPSTFNKRLSYLRSCCDWAVEKQLISVNPFKSIKPRKVSKQPIQPFTIHEMRAILRGFEARYSHYVPFVKFMFLTGVRTSEAIGLQWKHVNFERQEILICESLSKDRAGNGYRRVRKQTKTANIRSLRMNQELNDLMSAIRPDDALPDDLIFTSARGCVIDAGNFREDWKQILEELDIPYRKPYITRHTFLSHAIEAGVPVTAVSYIAGHADSRMVMQTYGHIINRPDLPEIGL